MGEDYDANLFELRNYNEVLVINGLEKIHLSIRQCPNFPKKIWDKMTANLAKSFKAWLKN